MTLHTDTSNMGIGGNRLNFLDVYNLMKHFPGQSIDIGGAPRTWKLKGLMTNEL